MVCDKKVSIIIAIYNMEKYLEKCICSVSNQSYQNFEVIMVNDGSSDTSEEIIDRYVEMNPTKFIKINKANGGLSSARNIAIPVATGEYITFLDADDYFDRDYLKELVNKAESEDLDVVCGGQHKITEDGIVLKTIRYRFKNGQCLQRRLNISGKLYRTSYIRKWDLKFPEGKTYEDNSFNLQALFLTPRIGIIEYEGYYQVVHEGSITSKPIDASRLPFEEWVNVGERVHKEHVDGVDIAHFDLIFMSFLTYFLMLRNRKREYLSNTSKSPAMANVYEITEKIQDLVLRCFSDYSRNRYTSPFVLSDIPFVQKMGTSVFFYFCKRKKLKILVRAVYMK